MNFFRNFIHRHSVSLRKGMFLLLFSISFLVVVGMTALWIYTEVKDSRRIIHEIGERTLENQKDRIKKETEYVLNFLNKMYSSDSSFSYKMDVLNYLQNIRFGYSGYVFINTMDGKALIFDGKKVSGTKDIHNLTDANGLRLFPLEIKAAENPDGGFVQYVFKKIDDTIPHPKISYIAGFKPLHWIVGAGDYVDDAHNQIKVLQTSVMSKIKKKVISIILVLIIISFFLIIFSDQISKISDRHLNEFIHYLQKPTTVRFQSDKVFIKEFRQIASKVVEIEKENSRISTELKRHKDHLEELVKKRTEELEIKNKKLEYFHELFITREFRIKELRDELKALKQQSRNKA